MPGAAIAQLQAIDLHGGLRFHAELPGLELAFVHGDFHAGLRAGEQLLHRKQVDTPDPSIGHVAAGKHLQFHAETDDAAALAPAIVARGVTLVRPVHDTPWGTHESGIRDDQGHGIQLGQERASAGEAPP